MVQCVVMFLQIGEGFLSPSSFFQYFFYGCFVFCFFCFCFSCEGGMVDGRKWLQRNAELSRVDIVYYEIILL